MVKICENTYENSEYNEHFKQFPFDLSPFQKWSIQAIIEGKNSLITAHTGCGKTTPAEFVITYFTKINKKVIYTSPLKALSNQKLFDFRKKFPNISFGILTGDYKDNVDADVLIMTTEILKNTLFNKKMNRIPEDNIGLRFDMDIENELGCVVFDEVHYITDENRGGVWEQSIMLLPKKVQMLMLSATISRPEIFAKWVEHITENEVYLSSTHRRIVPLNHSQWITCQPSIIKNIKDQSMKDYIYKNINKLHSLKRTGGLYNDSNDNIIRKIKKYFQKNKIYIKRRFILNTLVKQLFESGKLPAICFVFSRKHVELCAKEIEISLFNDNEKHLIKDVERECETILRTKLQNVKEYLNLPEYKNIIRLLQKGIGIHHAGIMPVFREMIELLFEKNYIKLLFATETFAVGINMPTKTVIFTSLTKFNGHNMRLLHSYEYSQMAGRAGRRGIDTKGDIILCSNLFDIPDIKNFRIMLSGTPKELISKFKISYHLIIHILLTSDSNSFIDIVDKFTSKSMVHDDIKNNIKQYELELQNIDEKISKKESSILLLRTNIDVLKDFHDKKHEYSLSSNKKKKRINMQLSNIVADNKFIEKDYKYYIDYLELLDMKKNTELSIVSIKNYILCNIKNTIQILRDNKFIIDNNYSKKLLMANNIHETNPLVLSTLYEISEGFSDLTSKEICGLLSCFTNTRLKEEYTLYNPTLYTYELPNLTKILKLIKPITNTFQDAETNYQINTGTDYYYHYNLIEIVMKWYDSDTIEKCYEVIKEIKKYDIFLGEFVKSIIKINNIANELINACENILNIELILKLKEIPKMTLKYIVNENSLYI